MADPTSAILDALETALGANTVIKNLNTEIINEMPEMGTLRSNTIYMIRNGPELEERLLGNTDIYSCTCTSSFFFKPSMNRYIDGFSNTSTEEIDGERLLSAVFGEMCKVLKDITVSGVNIAEHGIVASNQSNASESSMSFYVAEVVTKTSYEA